MAFDWKQDEHEGKPELVWTCTPVPGVTVNIEPFRGGHEVAIFILRQCPGQKDDRPRRYLVLDAVFPTVPDVKREAERIYIEWLDSLTPKEPT